jgi:hypothetical protein
VVDLEVGARGHGPATPGGRDISFVVELILDVRVSLVERTLQLPPERVDADPGIGRVAVLVAVGQRCEQIGAVIAVAATVDPHVPGVPARLEGPQVPALDDEVAEAHTVTSLNDDRGPIDKAGPDDRGMCLAGHLAGWDGVPHRIDPARRARRIPYQVDVAGDEGPPHRHLVYILTPDQQVPIDPVDPRREVQGAELHGRRARAIQADRIVDNEIDRPLDDRAPVGGAIPPQPCPPEPCIQHADPGCRHCPTAPSGRSSARRRRTGGPDRWTAARAG